MVHKKYTYKDGKKFGPYYYETKRVNGKVVTTYLGTKNPDIKSFDYKKLFGLFLVLLILISMLGIYYYRSNLTGRVSLELEDASYFSGDNLGGNVKVTLKSGELIPADTKVYITLDGVTKESTLNSLVDSNSLDGVFYASGSELSGEGKGFGLKGIKEIPINVSFKLRVFDPNYFIGSSDSDRDSEISNYSVDSSESNNGENISSSNDSSAGDNSLNESGENSELNNSSSKNITIENNSSAVSDVLNESSSLSSSNIEEENVSSGNQVEESSDSLENSNVDEVESSGISGITGAFVKEYDYEVSGKVVKGEVYNYELEEGFTAELVEGSVLVKGDSVDNSYVSLSLNGNNAEVTTDYALTEEGFGERYLGDNSLDLIISLDKFGFNLNKSSKLIVSLAYEDTEIATSSKNLKVNSNETDLVVTDVNVTVNTTQFGAVLGSPVKWRKKVSLSEGSNLTIKLPKGTENVTVLSKVLEDSSKVLFTESTNEVTDNVSSNNESSNFVESYIEVVNESKKSEEVVVDTRDNVLTGNAVSDTNFVNNFLRATGFVSVDTGSEISSEEVVLELNESVKEVEIEYETPAPYSEEFDSNNGKTVKIIGPDEVHYENVLAFTGLDESFEVKELSKVKIYWEENETYLEPYTVLDIDENGIYDYIEWIVPHLSNQTFEIILVTLAEHLDENKTFVSDIYDSVKELDGNWSESIKDGEYVRITFERNLTSDRDITIYPRIILGDSENIGIEIYEENGVELISEFNNLIDNSYNKVYLSNLQGEQDTFDLKIIGGSIEFDHIIDPETGFAPNITFVDPTFNDGSSVDSNSIYVNVSSADEGEHYSIVDFNNSLILWMRFDDVNSSGDPTDLSTYSKNGILNGGAAITSGGIYGNKLVIDEVVVGGAQYVDIPNLNLSELAWPNGTVSFWINHSSNSPSDFARIISNEYTNNVGVSLRTSSAANSRLDFRFGNAAGTAFGFVSEPVGSYAAYSGNWTHYVLVWSNGQNLTLWRNGIYVTQDTTFSDTLVGNTNTNIANDPPTQSDDNWDMQLDDIMIFNRRLDKAEIGSLFNATASQYYHNFTELSYDNYNFTAYAVDTAGNLSSVFRTVTLTNVLIDGIPPNISFGNPTPSDGSIQRNKTVVINITSSDDSAEHYTFLDLNNDNLFWSRMDEVNSSNDPTDISSWSHNGTTVGTVTFNDTSKFGNASWFDGSTGYIYYNNFNSEISTTNGSISAWVYFDSAIVGDSSAHGIIEFGSSTLNTLFIGFRKANTNDVLLRYRVGSVNYDASIPDTQFADSWQHLVGTWNDTSVNLYVNGTLIDSQVRSGTIDSATLDQFIIGADGIQTQDLFFDGGLDEVLFFNRTLKDSEVASLYNSTANQYYTDLGDTFEAYNTYTGYSVDLVGNYNLTNTRTLFINQSPIATSIILNSTNGENVTNVNLTAYATSIDLESDNIYDNYDWRLNNISIALVNSNYDVNDTVERDYSTNQNNGSDGSAIWISRGAIGGAYNLSGNANISHGSIYEVQNLVDSTFMFWLKPEDITSSEWLLTSGASFLGVSQYYGYFIGKQGANISIVHGNGAEVYPSYISNILSSDEWVHIAITRESTGNYYLYRNGVLNETFFNAGPIYTAAGIAPTIIGGGCIQSTCVGADPVYYNGLIDEVKIFNRTLSAEQVNLIYNNQSNILFHEETNPGDSWNVCYTPNDLSSFGTTNCSNLLNINNNLPTNFTSIYINSTSGTNKTLEDLHSIIVVSDLDGDYINVTAFWFNDSVLSYVQSLNNSYSNGSTVNFTLSYTNTTKYENWSVGYVLSDYLGTSEQVNSSLIFIENSLPAVTLTDPTNGASSTNRAPLFGWESTDDDSDSITYSQINVSLLATSLCTDPNEGIYNTTTSSTHQWLWDLSCLSDNKDSYIWSVRSTDYPGGVNVPSSEWGPWSSSFTYDVNSLVSISLNISTIQFGTIGPQGTNSTVDDNPGPLIIENSGNVFVNVTISATNLWQTVTNPSSYYQYKVDNVSSTGENLSFDPIYSVISFTNVPSVAEVCIANFNYTDNSDSAEVDINITVPPNEGSQIRSSNITFTASLAE